MNKQELFEQIGYELSINFVNAVNYGVPQSRERIFIVGYRKGLIYSFPSPCKLASSLPIICVSPPSFKPS